MRKSKGMIFVALGLSLGMTMPGLAANFPVVTSKKGPGYSSTTTSPSAYNGLYVSAGPAVGTTGTGSVSVSSTGPSATYSSSSVSNTRKRVAVNTYAQNGWQSDQKGRWYLFSDGTYPVSCWEKVDGKFYHFNAAGYMEWNTWIHESNGAWYFVTSSGEMATGWNNIGEKWYYMDPANGIMYTAGVHVIDGKTYCIKADGSRVTDEWVGGYYYDSTGARA